MRRVYHAGLTLVSAADDTRRARRLHPAGVIAAAASSAKTAARSAGEVPSIEVDVAEALVVAALARARIRGHEVACQVPWLFATSATARRGAADSR